MLLTIWRSVTYVYYTLVVAVTTNTMDYFIYTLYGLMLIADRYDTIVTSHYFPIPLALHAPHLSIPIPIAIDL